ncbi:unnamed protein product [Diamesa tonsa]
MVKITIELIRKKSEHNELCVTTLEELSLHQENIEKLELIHDVCRDLKILLLQSNLIAKIENLNKLKKLQYLNLAINNVEKIENLTGLESLQKLDLTLNFIGELTSVESLQFNYNLEELYLTGNPCTDYPCYRDYVISSLPQLKTLDGVEVTRTERFKAQQSLMENRHDIIQLQAKYQITRDEQKLRVQSEIEEMENIDLDDEEKLKEFWNRKSENCPEVRKEIASKSKRENADKKVEKKVKIIPRLFADCGRPYCLNLCKLEFTFQDNDDTYELDLHVYKFLDTSLIDVDVQINYVRVTIKGKVFQMALKDEIKIDESSSKRSQATGHLLIIMPKLNFNRIHFEMKKGCQRKCLENGFNKELTGVVNIKNILKQQSYSDSDVPPLI